MGFFEPAVYPCSGRSVADIIENREDSFAGERLLKELSYIRDGSRVRLEQASALADATQRPVYLTGFRRMRKGRVALELRDDGLAGCLRTVTGGSSKQLLVTAKPGRVLQMRYLSAREYARLQGVPNTFWVPESVTGLHALGDAVAVPVLEWLGRVVANAFANEPVPT